MPNNKYLYLSSINATDASDFIVNLPENLIIQPYSEVRAVSVRVNPNNNAVEIKKDVNDRFYIGIDNWNKFNQAVPPLMVTLPTGIYDTEDLEKELKNNIEEDALQHFCYCRGGLTISSANDILTFKISQMQMYGIPSSAIPDGHLELYTEMNDSSYNFEDFEIDNCDISKARMSLTNTIYGVKIDHSSLEKSLFLSPEIVDGLVNYNIEDQNNSKANAPVTAHWEIDTENMNDTDEMFITFGYFGTDDIYNENDSKRSYRVGQLMFDDETSEQRLNIGDLGEGQTGSNNILFIVLVRNKNVIVIRPRLNRENGSYEVSENILNMTENARLKIDVTEYEQVDNENDISASFFNLKIDQTTDDGQNYTNLFSEENYKALQYSKNYFQLENKLRGKRCLIDFNTNNQIEVLASFACDDAQDEDGSAFNRHEGDFVKRQSLNTSLTRVFTIFPDTDLNQTDKESISAGAIESMKEETGLEGNEKIINEKTFLWNKKSPNIGLVLGLNDDINDGVYLSENNDSFSTGIVADEKIDFEEQQFPQYYLDIPTLPLGNISANYLQGRKNTFICPIDLQASENNINLYTSQLYTMNYNQLTNSYPLNINAIKVRICNIDGSVAKGIDKETIVCLEIRDNPDIKNNEMIMALRSIEKNYSPGSAPGNFVKDQ